MIIEIIKSVYCTIAVLIGLVGWQLPVHILLLQIASPGSIGGRAMTTRK